MAKRHNQNDVIEVLKNSIGDGYDYSKVEYTGNHNKVVVVCPEHGEFSKTPAVLKKGYGCNQCSNARQIPVEEVLRRFRLKHGSKFDYSKVNYRHQYEKVEIICRIHGSFFKEPVLHWKGGGCPRCNNGEAKTYRYVYKTKNTNLRLSYKAQEICTVHG